MTRHRTNLLIAIVALLTVALVGGGLRVIRQRDEAARISGARGLALQAEELRKSKPPAALLLGAIAISVHADADTRSALMRSLVSERRGPLPGTDNIKAVSLSADGKVAVTTGPRQGVIVWSLSQAAAPDRGLSAVRSAVLGEHADSAAAVALSPDGRTAMTGGDDGTLQVWDLGDPSRPVERATLKGEGVDAVGDLALTHDGTMALIGYGEDGAAVWDLAEKSRPQRLSTLPDLTHAVRGLALSADGRTAVTIDQQAGYVWNLTDRARPVRLGTLAHAGTRWESVALSADGRTAVTGGQGSTHVWDLTDRARPVSRGSLPGLDGTVYDIALTSDGRTALTSEYPGLASIWDLRDRFHPVEVAALDAPGDVVDAVALNADGRIAALGTADWGGATWDLSGIIADPLRAACGDARIRNLQLTGPLWASLTDGAEWPAYLGDQANLSPCSDLPY